MNRVSPYRTTDYASRICKVCSSPMFPISDGFISLSKCLECGYSFEPTGHISDMHYYDRPVFVLASFLTKKGYYEMYTDPSELLYNALYSKGWDKTEITYQVINDLHLKGDRLDYFLRKVDMVL